MVNKVGRLITCCGPAPTSKSRDLFIIGTPGTKKTYICTSAIPVAAKFGRVITYGLKTPPTKLDNLLITWSRGKRKTLYLHFGNPYGHETWQSVDLRWGNPTFKVT